MQYTSHHKQRQLNCCFLLLFYLLSIISAFVTNVHVMSFIKALVRVRICLLHSMSCQRESSKTCYFSTVLTLLLLTMVSVSHIYCRQIACFPCICLCHRGCLIWVKFVKILMQKFQSQLTESTSALFSDKASCFSQSEHTLYGNFIINYHNDLMTVFSYKFMFRFNCNTIKFTKRGFLLILNCLLFRGTQVY